MSWHIVETVNGKTLQEQTRLTEFRFLCNEENHTLKILCLPDGVVKLQGDNCVKIIDERE